MTRPGLRAALGLAVLVGLPTLGLSGCGPNPIDMMGMMGMQPPPEVATVEPDPPALTPIDIDSMLPEEHACRQDPEFAGPTPTRLVTRVEYDNVVQDLVGDVTLPAQAFPIENETLGFENGEAHTANPLLVERYLEAAEGIAERAQADGRINGLLPCSISVHGEAQCGNLFIEDFGQKAFRRPLTSAEMMVFQTLFNDAHDAWGFEKAIQLVLQAILQSPQFLYRIEVGSEPLPDQPVLGGEEGAPGYFVVKLTSHEMASRLSFFLWNSTPDDELLTAANNGALKTPLQIEAQARRMLADARARGMVWDFHRQWLDADRLDGITKDETANPTYDPAMRGYWKSELMRFVDHAVFDEGTVDALLTSNQSFVNNSLAGLYGIDPPTEVDEEGFGPVTLDEEKRAGLLTQPALMALLALPEQSSPIMRGVFVREEIFCQPLQPPPPDVVVIPPDPDPNATTRERFAQHTEDPQCQGCHINIDPLGFGFERYDAIGRYRDEENGLPIDDSGEVLNTGEETLDGPFLGAVELAEKVGGSQKVRECLATHWFRYTYGRKEMPGDEACNLSYPLEVAADTDGDVIEILVALTQTHAFRYRIVDAPEGS